MRIKFDKRTVSFLREDNDPKFYGVAFARGESQFFHWIKKVLKKGHPDIPEYFPRNFIKKRMWKDGHMVDCMQQYLRTNKPVVKTGQGDKLYICLYNPNWSISGAEKNWNEGEVSLRMELVRICAPELRLSDPQRIIEQSKKVWEQIGTEIGL